jgi:hypothetical protein
MHQELRHELNIHKISEKLYKGTIKICIIFPFFFVEKIKDKNNKDMLKWKRK